MLAELAQALVEVLPKHLPHVFLANSGAEAVDGALDVLLAAEEPWDEGCEKIGLSMGCVYIHKTYKDEQ